MYYSAAQMISAFVLDLRNGSVSYYGSQVYFLTIDQVSVSLLLQ